MRDGVRLATDIYMPADENGVAASGGRPVVLARTPYDKTCEQESRDAAFFAKHGYVAVVQDCRGRFSSEGVFRPFRDEALDGADTLEWLGTQPFCNGRVGTHGCSYGAWVQLQMATQGSPMLRTMIPHTGPSNAYYYSMHVGGTRTLGLLRWHLEVACDSQEAQRNPRIADAIRPMLTPEGFLRWAAEVPWQRGTTPLASAPAYEDSAFQFYFEHDDYRAFWRDPALAMDEYFDAFPVMPILWITGWYEVYARSIFAGFAEMVERKRPHQYLLAGPWTHNNFDAWNGDANYGVSAGTVPVLDATPLGFKLRWFNRWLKDRDDDLGSEVKLFVMGGGDGRRGSGGRLNHGGQWLTGTGLPLEGTLRQSFYLHGDGTLSDQAALEPEASTTYLYDPRRSLYSDGRCEIAYGPASESGFTGMGPFDQIQIATLPGHNMVGLPVAARRDVVVFQTPPLICDLMVAGEICAVLYVSSDAPDTDFFVKLIDVYPPTDDYPAGYAFPVTDGILRARYREGFESATMMSPGEVYKLTIPVQPAGNVFKAGHRLRLDIASSSFPNFDINQNSGDPENRVWRIAQNTIHHDSVRASRIELPIVTGPTLSAN
jgi:hypothetical protein